MNITDAIRKQAQLNPDAPAVVRRGDRTVTYRDLDRTIDASARRALDLGLRPGLTAAISLAGNRTSDPYPFLILALALARIGVASGPATLPVRHATMSFVAAATGAPDSRTVLIDEGWYEAPRPEASVESVSSHQDGAAICRIFPSSGTTGSPKYIAISHEMMRRRLVARQRDTPFSADLRQISAIGPANHYWFRDALNCLSVGGMQILMPFTTAGSRYRVNYLIAPPAILERIIANLPSGAGPFPSLATIEVGGAHLSPKLAGLVREKLGTNIVCSYGSTESGPVARAPLLALEGNRGAVGYLDTGVEVQSVDENDRPLAPGEQGILRIRSDTCVAGYFDDPQATARSFRNGWFYPGDLGAVSSEGILSVAGRTDELINRGGNKINPQRIDEVLLSVKGVREAAAFEVVGASGVPEIWAAIVLDGPVEQRALVETCKARLERNAPAVIMKFDRLPRNDTGKVMRRELARMAVERRAAGKGQAGGETPGTN